MNESQPSQPPQYNTPTPPTNYQQNSNSYPGNNSYITSNVTSYEQLQPPPYNATILPNSNMTYNLPPTTPLISTNICWGETPVRYTCQFCSSQIVTNVVYENGTLTWLTAGGLCLLGCWLGCCLIPFALDSFKDPVHICPVCHNIVGRKSRI